MEIVIKIPEDMYIYLSNGGNLGASLLIEKAIKNGTPLPKGHGDLIDRDELEPDTEWDNYYDGFTSYSEMQIRNADTIIEADNESEE